MAFRAGIKSPKQYSQNNQQGNQSQNTYDRLVTVTDYDLAKNYMYAEDDKGKKFEIFVNTQEVMRAEASLDARGQDRAKINWMGHSIDEKMKKAIPPKSKVVLLRSRVISNDKTRDVAVTEVHRVVGVPTPDADKAFSGIFTMTWRMDEGKKRVSRIQHWNPTGIDINNEEGISKLATQIDEARKNYGTKLGEYNVTEPSIGVQFRALVKTDKIYQYNNKEIYEVVDTSLPFDWIPGPEDNDGNEIKSEAHVLTGDEMKDFAEQYIGYISEHDQFKDNLDNMRIEVCFYHVYPASKNDSLLLTSGVPEKDKNADKNPLYQLSHRKSFADMEQSEPLIGRNAAVNGIIQISANKLEKVDGKPVEIPNYWVNKLHANNIRGHVHSFVRTEDGHKAEPHPSIQLIRNDQQEATNAPARAAATQAESHEPEVNASASTHTPAPAVKDNFDPFGGADGSVENFDPFAEDAPEASAGEAAPAAGKTLRFGAKK